MVKITLSKFVTKNLNNFANGHLNNAINLVIMFESVLSDLELHTQVGATQALLTAKKASLECLIRCNVSATPDNMACREETINELKCTITLVKAECVDHF